MLRRVGFAVLFLIAAFSAAANDPVPLTNCDQLLAAAGQFDGLDDLLTNLKGDPFADAFDVYIRDIERLDSEGRELAQRIREIARNDCEPYMSEYSRWTLADADFRNSGCEGELPPEQYAACKPRFDNLSAWHDRLENQRKTAQLKIDETLARVTDFLARAKMPLLNAQNVLNPDYTEDAFRLYMRWYLRQKGIPPHDSCRALADLATVLGKRVKNQDLFIDYLVRNLVEPNTPLRHFMDPGGAAPQAGRVFGARGFRPKFFTDPNDNQVRHAAAHMRLGYELGVNGGANAVFSFGDDLARKYLNGQKPEWDDYYLALAAGQLGFRLKSGLLHTYDFGDAIRSQLCD